jgi:glycosidase
MKYLFLFFAGFLFSTLNGQVVTSDPTFPKATDQVTITFDAAKGTAGLKNCNCDVYLHTGVITSASNSNSDWKHVVTSWGVANPAWKMTKVQGQNNLYTYTISPDINAYYSINTNEIVKKLAFVFRNANGSKEGKDDGGKDIFIDVYLDNDSLLVTLNSPSQTDLIVNLNDTIPVNVVASQTVQFSLFKDSLFEYTVTGKELNYNIIVQNEGTHTVEIQASTDGETKKVSFNYTVSVDTLISGLPTGTEDGISILNDSTVILSLYAPNKKNVFVIGDFNDWEINSDYQLANTPDGKRWWIEIPNLDPEKQYAFQYLVDGSIKIGDPYSEIVLDPWNDKNIPSNIFPGLKPYPEDKTSGIVSVFSTKNDNFQWQNDGFEKPAIEKLIIYELLMRDFLKDHSYMSLTDTLDYLERLGVNAIELMPVNEFEGNNSWGYNPSYHYALDKYYGDPVSFKTLVDEAHSRGIAVILDVVYNHAFSQCPLVQLYWDNKNYQPTAESPWFNQVAKHPFNVGYDFNHESKATKYYVKRGLKHWIKEYHVDGFRFDLSKGFTQKQSYNNTQMSAYDEGRIAILKDYADFIWAQDSKAYVILEHFAANNEETVLSDYGMMLWGNMNYSYNEASMGYSSNLSWVTHKERGWSKPHLVGYMESHDEERLMYKNLKYGNSSGTYSVKNLPIALDRMELNGIFFFTLPGPKMIWEFGELGYNYSINRCEDGSINDNCRLSPKPIRWDYKWMKDRSDLFDFWSRLITLKKEYDIFNSEDFTYSLSSYQKSIHFNSDDENVVIVGNFSVKPSIINPAFQHSGWWYDYFGKDSINVINTSDMINLKPGEYHLYSDKKLDGFVTSVTEKFSGPNDIVIYPNPVTDYINIIINGNKTEELTIIIIDITGSIASKSKKNIHAGIDHLKINTQGLHKGFYLLKIPELNIIKGMILK